MQTSSSALLLSGLALGLSCLGEEDEEGAIDAPSPDAVLDEARESLPTYLDLHTQVIARTCSPDDGVCHNAKEYPDLTTPLAMLGHVAGPCNKAIDDPMDVFDGCEVVGDSILFPYGPNADFSTEIAYTVTVEEGNATHVEFHLREAIPEAMGDLDSIAIAREYPDEGTIDIAHIYNAISYEKGEKMLLLENIQDQNEYAIEVVSEDLLLGDPNQNDVFGADEDSYLLLAPGEPDRSYLLGRLLGTLPGTPMPLANQPLSSAEMVALVCWIEGLNDGNASDPYAKINYDDCQAAADFGQPDPDSGHSFAGDVLPILDRCTAGGCHGGDSPASGLDLREAVARNNLLKTAEQDPTRLRVMPGNPTDSYLMLKLRGTGLTGLQMPREQSGPGEPLEAEELRIIEEWIIAGAPDD